MIPKIIHYCWFGAVPKPKKILDYINIWRDLNPDFKIMEWNEENFDVCTNHYVREAYNAQMWAFVSDYVRLFALYNYGGIYLDTDVEAIKSFDFLLKHKWFMGAESEFSMCTATIGSERYSDLIKEIMNTYENEHFIVNGKMNKLPNSQRIFYILKYKYKYRYSPHDIQIIDTGIIYPPEYFSPINCYTLREKITDNTISIHRYASTWKSKDEKIKNFMLAFFTRIVGEKKRNKLKNILRK